MFFVNQYPQNENQYISKEKPSTVSISCYMLLQGLLCWSSTVLWALLKRGIILKAAFLIFYGGLRLLQRVGFGLQVHINTNTKVIAAVTCGHCQPILRMMVSLHPLIFPFMYLLPVNLLTARLPSTKSNFSLNSFPANGLIFYPLKTTENERFSSAFKKYKMDKASNGLQEKSSFILQVQPR